MILVETWYKTYNLENPAIAEAFKTWRYYLESYKYNVLVFINHNNLRHFMDTNSLSSCQIGWAQNSLNPGSKSIIVREILML